MNILVRSIRAALPLLTLTAAMTARADDAVFTHTILAETLPKGASEVEQRVTFSNSTSRGTYELWQSRTEFEYGVTDRWKVALNVNVYSVTAENNNSNASRVNFAVTGDGDEVSGGGPATFGRFVPFLENLRLPSSRYEKTSLESISVESVYQFLSPYKNAVGLTGYVEYGKGSLTEELELKVLAQKNLLDDALILATNVVAEFEKDEFARVGNGEKEVTLEFTTGASYKVAQGWRVGLELRNQRGYEGAYSVSADNKDYSAWYAGPTVQYAGRLFERGFFLTAGYQEQLPWARAYSPAAKAELVNDRVLKDTEKHVARLLFGVSF
jgi:hypothetical protein